MSGVRRYYERNTWKFLLTGSARAIHRELWAPGVTDRRAAMHHAHARIGDALRAIAPDGGARVLDLGCGVGTAALYLAERWPCQVIGVSISPAQIRWAERFAARPAAARRGSVRFEVADFTALPAGLHGFALAFAIESFVHATEAAEFFREAARALAPGGQLVVLDDVVAAGADPADPRLADVRAGWQMGALISVAEAAAVARPLGLVLEHAHDLSAYQRLGRPRDRIIRALQPMLRRARSHSAWAASLVGGDALQRCHLAGLLEYRELHFRRTG